MILTFLHFIRIVFSYSFLRDAGRKNGKNNISPRHGLDMFFKLETSSTLPRMYIPAEYFGP